MNVGSQSRKVNFYDFAARFEFIEVSLICDRSDQHQTMYDNYDLELAVQNIQSLTPKNAANTYSITRTSELNIDNEDDEHLLYLMFAACSCEGYSAALLTQYRNNKIYQELTKEKYYFKDSSDTKMYIDMRKSKGYTNELEKFTHSDIDVSFTIRSKTGTTKKVRLKVVGYSQSEYFYTTSSQVQIMTFKRYSVTTNNNIEA